MRYYPLAKKCKLDSPWVGPYLVVSLAGWAAGVQLQPDSPIILVHCQDLKKIPHPSGLVSWIDVALPEGLPAPPILGASTMCRSTRNSPSTSIVAPVDRTLLSIPASRRRGPCYIIRRVWLLTYLREPMAALLRSFHRRYPWWILPTAYIRSTCTGWMLALFTLRRLLMRSIIASRFCGMA